MRGAIGKAEIARLLVAGAGGLASRIGARMRAELFQSQITVTTAWPVPEVGTSHHASQARDAHATHDPYRSSVAHNHLVNFMAMGTLLNLRNVLLPASVIVCKTFWNTPGTMENTQNTNMTYYQ